MYLLKMLTAYVCVYVLYTYRTKTGFDYYRVYIPVGTLPRLTPCTNYPFALGRI